MEENPEYSLFLGNHSRECVCVYVRLGEGKGEEFLPLEANGFVTTPSHWIKRELLDLLSHSDKGILLPGSCNFLLAVRGNYSEILNFMMRKIL